MAYEFPQLDGVVPGNEDGHRVVLHVPNNSAAPATRLVSEGVPVNDVAGLIRHERISTTLNRCTHASRDRNSRAQAVFAGFSLTPAPEPSADTAPHDPGR